MLETSRACSDSGVRFVGGTALGKDITLEGLIARYDAVYLALGLQKAKHLTLEGTGGVPGAPSVKSALELLRGNRSGCRPALGQHVVVIGGGNAAVDASRTAQRLGPESVIIASIERREQMPAIASELNEAETEGVRLVSGVTPLRLEAGGIIVRGLESGEERRLEADTVILAIGQEPALHSLGGDVPLERTTDGHLAVESGEPSDLASPRLRWRRRRGRSADGDRRHGIRFARCLGDRLSGTRHRRPRIGDGHLQPTESAATDTPAIDLKTPRAARQHPSELDVELRIGAFSEVVGTLDRTNAQVEASRCLSCGLCGNCRACIDTFACPALQLGDRGVEVDRQVCAPPAGCVYRFVCKRRNPSTEAQP